MKVKFIEEMQQSTSIIPVPDLKHLQSRLPRTGRKLTEEKLMETTGPTSTSILGVCGYRGWPMCLHLSRLGHRVVAVDNLARRQWDVEGGSYSLVPIASMEQRGSPARGVTGAEIGC